VVTWELSSEKEREQTTLDNKSNEAPRKVMVHTNYF
jgi:hypothetical protein